jgi:hypothetical protein
VKKKRTTPEQAKPSSEPFDKRMVEDVNAVPLDQTVFIELVEIANEVLAGRRLVLPPDSERCLGEAATGPVWVLTGHRENQMGLAIVKECRRRFGKKNGEKIFFSFMMRWFQILRAIHDGVLTEFIRKGDAGEEIYDGVFRAAANCPLNLEGKFDAEVYVSRIRTIKDGSTPTFMSSYYSAPIALSHSATLRGIAYSADFSQWAEAPPIQLTVIPVYTLATQTAGGGTIQVSPGDPLTNGVVANVTATPLPGWSFWEWLGDASGSSPTIAVTMNRNKTVEARFGTSLSTTVAGNGSVAVFPSVPLLPYGTFARLTATPRAGDYFGVWGNAASGNANPLYFPITNANPVVSSLFAPLSANQYSLVVVPNGEGRVTNSPTANFYNNGQSVTVAALPNAGQSFTGWSGDATGSANPLSVTINQSKTIMANFTKRPMLSAASASGQTHLTRSPLLETGFGYFRVCGLWISAGFRRFTPPNGV